MCWYRTRGLGAPPSASIDPVPPSSSGGAAGRGSRTIRTAAFASPTGTRRRSRRGDRDGNGSQTQGVFRKGAWFLTNTLGNPHGDYAVSYGQAGDRPIVGDWDGDGIQTVGVHRRNLFLLSNSNRSPATTYAFTHGDDGDVAVVGDWDGDGVDTVGTYRSGSWNLRNEQQRLRRLGRQLGSPEPDSSEVADIAVTYGAPTTVPIVGDWDSDGRVGIGVFYRGGWHLATASRRRRRTSMSGTERRPIDRWSATGALPRRCSEALPHPVGLPSDRGRLPAPLTLRHVAEPRRQYRQPRSERHRHRRAGRAPPTPSGSR